MKFSVIIPTYQRNEDLYLCLSCLDHYFEQDDPDRGFELEVLVSDDARDESLQAGLAEKYPWATYLPGPARGPAANRNHGAKHAQGDWLVFTDDDCQPQAGWIEEYASQITEDTDVLEGKTISTRPFNQVLEEAPINESGNRLWSCNFAINRKLFWSLTGFDEFFTIAGGEDTDLQIRINSVPRNCKWVPNAIVCHPPRKRRRGLVFAKNEWGNVALMVKIGMKNIYIKKLKIAFSRIASSFSGNISFVNKLHFCILSLVEFAIIAACGPFWIWRAKAYYRDASNCA